jgi:hypothetical protein
MRKGLHPACLYCRTRTSRSSTTIGGPIRKDRIHFFGAYEFEREPKTYIFNSQYAFFNINQEFPTHTHKALGRLDYQFTPQSRLSVRVSRYQTIFYALAGSSATNHPVGERHARTEIAGICRHLHPRAEHSVR